MFGFVKSPDTKDKIHAIVIVIDASTFDVMPEAVIAKTKDLQTVFNARGLFSTSKIQRSKYWILIC